MKAALLKGNLYTINKNGPQTNTSKIDGIAFHGRAHTQQGSRKLILNRNGSKFYSLIILKYKNKDILQLH